MKCLCKSTHVLNLFAWTATLCRIGFPHLNKTGHNFYISALGSLFIGFIIYWLAFVSCALINLISWNWDKYNFIMAYLVYFNRFHGFNCVFAYRIHSLNWLPDILCVICCFIDLYRIKIRLTESRYDQNHNVICLWINKNAIKSIKNASLIDLEFVHANSKCHLKTSIIVIIGEQSSRFSFCLFLGLYPSWSF